MKRCCVCGTKLDKVKFLNKEYLYCIVGSCHAVLPQYIKDGNKYVEINNKTYMENRMKNNNGDTISFEQESATILNLYVDEGMFYDLFYKTSSQKIDYRPYMFIFEPSAEDLELLSKLNFPNDVKRNILINHYAFVTVSNNDE